MRQSEQARLYETTAFERDYWQKGLLPGGMDEVGRGPLAGPVVAACVVMPPEPLLEYVKDSKKVSEKRRELLYPQILDTALCAATGWIGPDVIDEINILQATRLAFAQAYEKMRTPPAYVLVDALKALDIPAAQQAIVHGDALSYLIAAASIVAKVERDRYMLQMHEQYPVYHFDQNKGYGTAAHMAALRAYGPCPIHRRSFLKSILEGA